MSDSYIINGKKYVLAEEPVKQKAQSYWVSKAEYYTPYGVGRYAYPASEVAPYFTIAYSSEPPPSDGFITREILPHEVVVDREKITSAFAAVGYEVVSPYDFNNFCTQLGLPREDLK